MKKRLLLISLMLVLALTLAMPAAAYARDNTLKPGAPTAFTGNGEIYITYMPEPIENGNIWSYQDEIVEGYLLNSDWEAMAGTAFWSSHDSVVKVSDDGSVWGYMWGKFRMTRFDGEGELTGTFLGKISGNLFYGDIYDSGTWTSDGGSGVFKNVRALGDWSAKLHPGNIPGTPYQSLVGPLVWEGKYTCPTSPVIKPWKWDNTFKPGKPVKPWQPVKPGRPWWNWFWPWG
jgi:hypothetical protein